MAALRPLLVPGTALRRRGTVWAASVGLTRAHALTRSLCALTKWVYFEIGNEENFYADSFFGVNTSGGDVNNNNYPPVFAAAAQGLHQGMGSNTNYTILTGGMLRPTASHNGAACYDRNGQTVDLGVARDAVQAAYSNGVALSNLGFAVHPYFYSSPDEYYSGAKQQGNSFWRNFYTSYGTAGYSSPAKIKTARSMGPCSNLRFMVDDWKSPYSYSSGGTKVKQALPVVFTEINWVDTTGTSAKGGKPSAFVLSCNDLSAGCSGTYLVDLFTWLHDHGYTQNPSTSQLRVMWFTGADFTSTPPKPLGIYTGLGKDKPVTIASAGCPNAPKLPDVVNKKGAKLVTSPDNTIDRDYRQLRTSGCYDVPRSKLQP